MMVEGCENIITKTGWGLFHYFLIGFCAICTMAEASASLTVIIATPLLACDLNYNKTDIITLNAISSLGMAVGSLLLGTLTDHNGRKIYIPSTMVLIFCASIGLSFSQTYFLMTLCIFVLGIGISGSNTTLRVYLSEFLPAKERGKYLVFLDLSWIIGLILSLSISWSLMPSIIRMLGNEFRPSSWRVLVGLAGVPSLMMACAASLIPATPRYLLYQRDPQSALIVLQQMFAINNSQHADNFPPCNLCDLLRTDDENISSASFFDAIKKFFIKIWRRIMLICSAELMKTTVSLFLVRLILFPGFTWLAFWKAQLLQNNTYKPSIANETCTTDIGDVAMDILNNCNDINNFYFEFSLIFSLSFVLGEALLFVGIDVIGRRLSLVTSGLIGGTSILALLFTTRHDTQIVLSMLFLSAYAVVYTTTSVQLLENYPTSVRGTVLGLTSVLPSLTSFFVKFITSIACTTSLYIVSGLFIGATIAAMPITDLTNAPMTE